tara:strand:+ start:223 stop:558 length:336 start_codon:yes stop_codon:yes gene_type:complete
MNPTYLIPDAVNTQHGIDFPVMSSKAPRIGEGYFESRTAWLAACSIDALDFIDCWLTTPVADRPYMRGCAWFDSLSDVEVAQHRAVAVAALPPVIDPELAAMEAELAACGF